MASLSADFRIGIDVMTTETTCLSSIWKTDDQIREFYEIHGRTEDYKRLMELSAGWEKLFDDSLKMIRPRVPNGEFIDNFNPLESWRGFQEGNAMQYTFFVPQNPARLIEKVGKDEFNNRLDSIFTEARKSIFGGGKVVNAFSGLQSPYNHGNQPSLHISWLFNFSGKPYLTQKWTRLICDEFYGTNGEHGYVCDGSNGIVRCTGRSL